MAISSQKRLKAPKHDQDMHRSGLASICVRKRGGGAYAQNYGAGPELGACSFIWAWAVVGAEYGGGNGTKGDAAHGILIPRNAIPVCNRLPHR